MLTIYNEHDLLRLLETYIQKYLKINNETSWIKNNILEGNLLTNLGKLMLLGKLWESKSDNNLWNLEEQYIFDLVILLFKDYIEEVKNYIPAFNDYKIYSVYHSTKKIGILNKKITSIFLKYWTIEKMEILCVHFTEMDPFTKSLYKITDTAIEIFGSKLDFINYVKKTANISNDSIKEFVHFFQLCEITRHTNYVIFQFEKSNIMKDKIETILKSNNRSTYDGLDNMSQIFFELSHKEFANKALDDVDLRNDYNLKISEYDSKWYIYSTLNRVIKKEDIITISKEIYKHFINAELIKIDDKMILNKENFIPENINNYAAKLFSAQPFPTK